MSDVLSLAKTRGFMSGGLDMGETFAFAFEADGAFRCFAVVSGQCWLSIADVAEPIRICEGDFFALPHGKHFVLSSDPALTPRDIYEEISGPLNGRVLSIGGGGGCCLFGALFKFRREFGSYLLEALPPVLHIGDGEARVALRAYLDRMMALLRVPQPGSVLVTEHLAETVLIEVLRLHFAHGLDKRVGLLLALSDAQLSRALTAIHERPWHRWSVQQLAEHAGMSRSAFAQRFKEKVGASAIEYLIRWRMLLAADRLVEATDPIGSIAGNVGYDSESAFVFAFRREMGCTPRQYRQRSKLGPPPTSQGFS